MGYSQASTPPHHHCIVRTVNTAKRVRNYFEIFLLSIQDSGELRGEYRTGNLMASHGGYQASPLNALSMTPPFFVAPECLLAKTTTSQCLPVQTHTSLLLINMNLKRSLLSRIFRQRLGARVLAGRATRITNCVFIVI